MLLSSMRSRLAASAALFVMPITALVCTDRAAPVLTELCLEHSVALPLPHPHFTKTVLCDLSKTEHITIKHLTVTFDKDGAAKMKVGGAWHLGGCTFECDRDLIMGGQKVAAGSYALSARKAAKGWQLTLHTGAGFSRPGDDAIAMQTEFVDKTLLFEHLNCDIQPGGDKKSTKLFLDVRFDTMLARVLIEIPE